MAEALWDFSLRVWAGANAIARLMGRGRVKIEGQGKCRDSGGTRLSGMGKGSAKIKVKG